MHSLTIGNKTAEFPIIQGGMGVGVSLGRLAGTVAREGGIGVISSAQIGFYRDDFNRDPSGANLKAIQEQVSLARELSQGRGMIGMNIMVALKDYALHVREAAKAGVDLIISGAGIPFNLPELVAGTYTKIAPIVSSLRCTKIIFKRWQKNYDRVPDLVVIEGPKAGGHLGFSPEEVLNVKDYDSEIVSIIDYVNREAAQRGVQIPVVVAGGIFDRNDIDHAFSLGASGVQIASRFVCTNECDASQAYKQAYINAKEEDVLIIKSPVGMPGRALRNRFTELTHSGRYPVSHCKGCLAHCNPAEIPYCITDALIRAVEGDTENGLVFCGANVGRIQSITSVHELMTELTAESQY